MTAEGEAGAAAAPEAGLPAADPVEGEPPGDPVDEDPPGDPVEGEPPSDPVEGEPPGDPVEGEALGDPVEGEPPAELADAELADADPAGEDPAGADVPAADPAARVADGIAHLEQAIAVFAEAAGSADSDIVPLAVELLARTLPLCERDEESAWAWQHGLEHPDPAVAAAVRRRLRRAFGSDEASWWEGFVESAVCHSTLPLLTNEVFGALDHMYALAAVPLARGGARTRELRDVLAQAVRVPTGYAWGDELLVSFRARFRDVTGNDTEAFPADWPAS
jgi:hypothetical protein